MLISVKARACTLKRKTIIFISGALILCTVILALIGTAISAPPANRTTSHHSGSIKGVRVGIYWDKLCKNTTSLVDWGTLEPGTTKSIVLYLRNQGNAAVTLSLQTSNWNPSNTSRTMTLNWNYTDNPISAGRVVPVKLSITVSSNATELNDFSFDSTITATS
jgi:hypothetical protein